MKSVPPLDLSHLQVTELLLDPRIEQAKKLLAEAVLERQNDIRGVQPPKKEQLQSYNDLLKIFEEYRGGKLYYPYIGSGFGKGALVELLDGSIKYDLISGIGVHYMGHLHTDLISVSVDAALSDTVMQGHLQQNLDTVELCELFLESSGMDHCFLTSSGAMATENGLKIALQKKFPANRILAFNNCFMGRTLALAQITDKPAFREQLPLNIHVDYVPFYDFKEPQESTQKSVAALKAHLERYPNQHAVMCFELIQGEGGFNVGTHEFFKAIMSVLKEHNIAVLIDEVQTFGRTTNLFAFQYFNLEEFVDIVAIGKLSLACATLFKNEYKPRPGLLSQTFTSSTAAIRSSKYILNHLINGHFFGPNGKTASLHREFLSRFQRLEKQYPDRITGPYGIGAMMAFTPFKGESKRVMQFVQDLFQAGIISFIAGRSPMRVRFLLPIGALNLDDIDPIFNILEEVLKR